MGATDRRFEILGVVPVPVGHRVRIAVYGQGSGLFSRTVTPLPMEPLVEDLDTGVVYSRGWLHALEGDGVTALEVFHGHELVEEVRGKVLACRVLSRGDHKGHTSQTTLVVAPEPPALVHR